MQGTGVHYRSQANSPTSTILMLTITTASKANAGAVTCGALLLSSFWAALKFI